MESSKLRPITVRVKEGDDVVLTLPRPLLEMLGLEDGETIKVPIHELLENYSAIEKVNENFEQAMGNKLFKTLINRIQTEYPLLRMEIRKSMVAFYNNKRGLLWIEYPKGRKVRVHLKKGDYSSVDRDRRVIPSGWGDYPEFRVEKEEDVDYLMELVKFAISHDKVKAKKVMEGF